MCAPRHRSTTHFTPGFFIFRLTPSKNLKLQMYSHTFSRHKHHTLLYLNIGGKDRLNELFKATSTAQENSYSRPSRIRVQHIISFLPATAFSLSRLYHNHNKSNPSMTNSIRDAIIHNRLTSGMNMTAVPRRQKSAENKILRAKLIGDISRYNTFSEME